METVLFDILRRIVAKAEDGPWGCVEFGADRSVEWAGGFRGLLWEAQDAVRAFGGRNTASPA